MRYAWWALTAAACLAPIRSVEATAPSAAVATDTLHVPYLAQSWLLCGGAAIAMIERWWGRRGVFAEDFAALVHPELGGIRTTDLVTATRARGWDAEPFTGRAARVQAALADSMPVLALIQVSPQRFHYVVIVAWHDDTVVFHDPAVGPYRSLDTAAFLAQWDAADRWALLVTPRLHVDPDRAPPSTAAEPTQPLPCTPWLDRAVDAAARGDLDEAEQHLVRARLACPTEPLILRERAGITFRRGEYTAAIDLARAYLDQVPADTLARQLLAISEYLGGDPARALASWNRIGQPTLDLLRIDGSRRIRFAVLADAIDLPLNRPLTSAALALAARRLADVPGVSEASVGYVPVTGDLVEVHARVLERPLVPSLPRLLVLGAARAVASDLTSLEIANFIGGGEQLTLEWRWRRSNPGLAARLEAPVHLRMPLVIGVSSEWERFRFDDGTETAQRQDGGVDLHAWLTPDVELMSAVHLERWGTQRYLALTLGGGLHDRRDVVALTGAVQQAVGRSGVPDYRRLRANIDWRSTSVAGVSVLSARIGLAHATPTAPRGLWPVAGGGASHLIPLRSRPFLIRDLLPSERTARTAVHGGIALDHPLGTVGPVTVGLGGFVDAAALSRRADPASSSRWFLDAGVGLEIGVPEMTAMQFRLDLARGLHQGGQWGLSAGLVQPWPPRATGFR